MSTWRAGNRLKIHENPFARIPHYPGHRYDTIIENLKPFRARDFIVAEKVFRQLWYFVENMERRQKHASSLWMNLLFNGTFHIWTERTHFLRAKILNFSFSRGKLSAFVSVCLNMDATFRLELPAGENLSDFTQQAESSVTLFGLLRNFIVDHSQDFNGVILSPSGSTIGNPRGAPFSYPCFILSIVCSLWFDISFFKSL